MRFLAHSCLLILVSASCKSRSDSPNPGPAPGPGSVAAANPTSASTRPKITDAQLEALLAAWLKTQNDGDFAAYQKLYAGKFIGVKRIGSRTYRYARKGWLADRGRMFKKKMTVEASKSAFNASTRTADINFVQRWASGKYEDVGRKRLMVVLEGKELKIAHEEMLSSDIVASRETPGTGFYFLLDGDLVLHDAEVPDEHGVPQEVEAGGEAIETSATVVEADLDDDTRAWKGKKVRIDGDCEATVTGFRIVSRVVPHFGYTQEWSCQHQEDDCVEATEKERAASAFALGDAQIVASLDGCDGGLYATTLDSPKGIEGEPIDDPKLAAMAMADFARLDAVTEQQESEDGEDHKEWWTESRTALAFKHPKSGQVLVSVAANNGGMCGEFSASHWQLWELKAGKLVPLGDGTPPDEIISAVDVNGDGRLELLVKGDGFGTEAALVDTATMSQPVVLSYTYGDCPC